MSRIRGLSLTQLLKTGQTIKYADGDDGDLELGISKDYTVLTTGQYAGTTNIVINGKTHALSNNCVIDNRTKKVWARYVPTADIGPAADGKLFWGQWTLASKTTISFDAASKEIRDSASGFNTSALCVGRKITVSGSANNNNTFTVVSITTSVCVVSETIVDEVAGASVSLLTVDDLIWDFCDQANANALGGFIDWRIPNYNELITIVDLGRYNPCIDTAIFPSTPASAHWVASTRPYYTSYAFAVYFGYGNVNISNKAEYKYYVRLVRE